MMGRAHFESSSMSTKSVSFERQRELLEGNFYSDENHQLCEGIDHFQKTKEKSFSSETPKTKRAIPSIYSNNSRAVRHNGHNKSTRHAHSMPLLFLSASWLHGFVRRGQSYRDRCRPGG
jgi:hypothetical protein